VGIEEADLVDDATQICDVFLVIMLAITDPKEHIAMLRKVIALIQDQELVGRIVQSRDAEEVYTLMADNLA